MQITISNEQKRIKLNIKNIEALTATMLKILKQPPEVSLSIAFFSRSEITRLNRRYFNRDRATDVIALGYEGKDRIYKYYLGDIAICPSMASENSKAYGNDFLYELTLCITHGILHLLGYNDTRENEKAEMRQKEQEVLRILWQQAR